MRIAIFILLTFIFTSCYVSKDVSKNKPLDENAPPKFEVNKKYDIYEKTGGRTSLVVTKVDSIMIYGISVRHDRNGQRLKKADFASSIKSMVQNSERITVYKFNPYWTFIPIVTGTVAMIVFAKYIVDDSFYGY